jgi:hypothetical protein
MMTFTTIKMPGINDAIPIILAFKKEGKFLKVSIS